MQKPMSYKPAMQRSWWRKHSFYVMYMLREATVLPMVFFACCLIAGLFALQGGEQSWQSWQAFMQAPWVIALNLLTLVAALFHAATFFPLFPRVMPIKGVPAGALVGVMWAAVIIVAVLFVAFFMGR